jgi:hypothetical protein
MAQPRTGTKQGGEAGSVSRKAITAALKARAASEHANRIGEDGRFKPLEPEEKSVWAILPVNLRPDDRNAIAAYCKEQNIPVARWAREVLLAALAEAKQS